MSGFLSALGRRAAAREAPRPLDLADIQGNILRPYGRFGFPITRHLFFNIGNAAAGRAFIGRIMGSVTTAERWGTIDDAAGPSVPRPLVAVNIALSYRGLAALQLPTRTLAGMPEEFIDGMAKRWSILGDIGPSAPSAWDPIWRAAEAQADRQVHILVSLNAQAMPDGSPVPALGESMAALLAAADASQGVVLLTGHRGANPDFQDSSAIMRALPDGRAVPTAREHFGFTDGIGDPTFVGQYEKAAEAVEVTGAGKLAPGDDNWVPLATGEFILGHANEAQELPPTAEPWAFMRNGTFMAYRKLHQNISKFDAYADAQAALMQDVCGMATHEEARATLLAKMVGRWQSGIPLEIAPTYAQAVALEKSWSDIDAIEMKGPARTALETARLNAYNRLITDFRYNDDIDGARCPVSAHIRRTNPRDALDPLLVTQGGAAGTALTNRRRILRRGAPYGESTERDDDGDHGVIFMALCASLFNQFEFVQQQWVHYGASFNVGNDTDPLVGLRRDGAKFVIAGEAKPFICANMPQFVETRGGEYFFLPSLTALHDIAQGSVDPT